MDKKVKGKAADGPVKQKRIFTKQRKRKPKPVTPVIEVVQGIPAPEPPVQLVPPVPLENPPAVISIGDKTAFVAPEVLQPIEKSKPKSKKEDYNTRRSLAAQEQASLAFEKFVELGNGRSLPKLSEATGINIHVIRRWHYLYKWSDKIKLLMEASISSTVVETMPEQMKKRKLNLRLIDCMLKDIAIFDNDGNVVGSKVELKSMSDVQRALETRENILNANDDRRKGMFGGAQIGQAVFIIKK